MGAASRARWPIARGPVGGDGLLLLTPGDDDCAFGMRMFNADGSEAETCLNGLRCVARAGFEALGIERARVRLKTSVAEASRDPALAPGVYTVRETAGPASIDTTTWPLRIDRAETIEQTIPPLSATRRSPQWRCPTRISCRSSR